MQEDLRQLNWKRIQQIMSEIMEASEQELLTRYYGLQEGKRDLRSLAKLAGKGVKKTKEEIVRLEKKLYLELKKRDLQELVLWIQEEE